MQGRQETRREALLRPRLRPHEVGLLAGQQHREGYLRRQGAEDRGMPAHAGHRLRRPVADRIRPGRLRHGNVRGLPRPGRKRRAEAVREGLRMARRRRGRKRSGQERGQGLPRDRDGLDIAEKPAHPVPAARVFGEGGRVRVAAQGAQERVYEERPGPMPFDGPRLRRRGMAEVREIALAELGDKGEVDQEILGPVDENGRQDHPRHSLRGQGQVRLPLSRAGEEGSRRGQGHRGKGIASRVRERRLARHGILPRRKRGQVLSYGRGLLDAGGMQKGAFVLPFAMEGGGGLPLHEGLLLHGGLHGQERQRNELDIARDLLRDGVPVFGRRVEDAGLLAMQGGVQVVRPGRDGRGHLKGKGAYPRGALQAGFGGHGDTGPFLVEDDPQGKG